jgi:O-acetylserine/cysteine efflux transporter
MRSLGALLLLAVMWGLSIPVTKLGLLSLPPLTLTALRYAIAAPLFFVCAMGHQLPPWRTLPRIAALGILGIGIGQVAQAFGVAGTSASVGTVISATIPIFIVFFAALRLKQRVSGLQMLGLVAAFGGIALVALGNGQDAGAMSRSTVSGAAWVLLSALSIALYYVWSVELSNAHGIASVAAWSTLFGFIALLPWAAWQMWRVPVHLAAPGMWVAAYLGIVVTVAGLFLWLNLLRTIPAVVAAGVQYLQPIIGVAAASAMFGDRLGAPFVVGMFLVLGGLALTMRPRTKTAAGAV